MRVGVIIIALLWCAWIAMFPLAWVVWADSKDVTIPLETKVEQAVATANRENQFVIAEKEITATNKITVSQIDEFLTCIPEGKEIYVYAEKTDENAVAKVYSAFNEDGVLYQYQELCSYQGWEVASYDANQATFRWNNYDGPVAVSVFGGLWGGTLLGYITYRVFPEQKPRSSVKLEEPENVPARPFPDIWGEEYPIPKKKEEKETITDPFEQKTLGVER